ncbi:MAG: hypothetical protein ACYCYF_02800 [Anaerolineae bacterium]
MKFRSWMIAAALVHLLWALGFLLVPEPLIVLFGAEGNTDGILMARYTGGPLP